ncbi:MAG: hypothetical protein ACT4SY_09750 [Hyphomicrobiales bacterium]
MAQKKPSRAVKLFGTELPDSKGRELRAGALSAIFDNGALRYIRLNGVEILRAVAFLVRDENWGTFAPQISNLKIKTARDGVSIAYDGRCADAGRALAYKASISCSAGGHVKFAVTALPETDFLTNRTGFVVLHPLQGVAGRPVTVEHTGGKTEKSKFPAIVDPVQPFYGIRSLRHQAMPGVFATVRMEGYAFEMEDHRNWTDASFKTYVRPLAEPWPYTLPKGVAIEQSVTVTLEGKLPKPRASAGGARTVVTLGRAAGRLPSIGIGIPMQEAHASLAAKDLIKAAGVAHLVCQIDGRRNGQIEAAAAFRELKTHTGARLGVEIILPGKAAAEVELRPIAENIKAAGLVPDQVTITMAADLKAVLPGSKAPPGPGYREMCQAARAAFPGIPVGGGMLSYFTELNRKKPPAGLFDFISHTTCPIVHAADDISVMETLEALPYVIASAKAFLKGTPYHVGPSSIACRDNPYGASVAANPGNGRVCLSDMDPRQRGLFGAAWTLGYMAAFCEGGIASLTMGSTTGPAGLIHGKAAYPQPWFDDAGAAVYPAYQVIAGLAPASGARRLAAASDNPSAVAALAFQSKQGPVLWLANLTGGKRTVKIAGFKGKARLHMPSEANFAAIARDPYFLSKGGKVLNRVSSVDLGPYAVARIAAA